MPQDRVPKYKERLATHNEGSRHAPSAKQAPVKDRKGKVKGQQREDSISGGAAKEEDNTQAENEKV